MLNKKLVIKISGINSVEDIKIIKDAFKKINDVKVVKMSLNHKKAIIIHDKSINILEIEKVINNLGYKYIGVE